MPFLNIPTVPNGKYQIKTADLIRAIPMVTSPFLRAKQHIDLWFVPYNLLWSRFNEFMVEKDEKLSSALKDRKYCPHVHLKELLDQIAAQSTAKDIVGQDFRKGAYRLLDSLGYPAFKYYFGDGMQETEKDKAVNLWPLLAYNYIWYTEYRQQYYDDGTHLASSGYETYMHNVDWLECSTADNADLIRNTGSGFSSLVYSMCQMRYRPWKKDLFTGLLPSTQFGSISAVDVSGTMTILNQISGNADASGDTNGGTADPTTYGKYVKSGSDSNRWVDVVTESDPSNVSVQVGVSGYPRNLAANGSGDALSHDHVINVVDSMSVSSNLQGAASFDVLALRKAEAVQIWRENALRAGRFLEDNFEAHYGVKPKSHMHKHPVHIGSIDAPLNIGDIDSHAQISSDGANQQLADVAGKGISSLGKGTFNFQTTDFGVILGIVSMLPETEYMSTGIELPNQKLEREDYYVSEYSKLGLQAIDSASFFFGGQYDYIPGYTPRDIAYKIQQDVVHRDFFNGGIGFNGVFRSWTSPKYDVFDALKYMSEHSGHEMPLSCLYVNPKIFDVNFSVGVADSRQFLVNYFFDVDGIQNMPVSGMPSY